MSTPGWRWGGQVSGLVGNSASWALLWLAAFRINPYQRQKKKKERNNQNKNNIEIKSRMDSLGGSEKVNNDFTKTKTIMRIGELLLCKKAAEEGAVRYEMERALVQTNFFSVSVFLKTHLHFSLMQTD